MPGSKSILLAVLVIVSMGTIGATSASAAVYEVSGGTLPEKIESSGGSATLKSSLFKIEILITCKKNVLKGEIETEGKSKGEIIFEECSIGNSKEKFTNCEVANIKIKARDQLVENTKSVIEDEFLPESKSLAEVVIKNSGEKTCAEKGNFLVEGTQSCELPHSEELIVEHEIKCSPFGSALTFDKEAATLEAATKAKPASGRKWQTRPTLFRATNAANNNVSLAIEQEPSFPIELKLAGTSGKIQCASGVTFQTQTLTAPSEWIKLKPTFPATCSATIAGEASVSVTVEMCTLIEIQSGGFINIATACTFKVRTAGLAACSVKIETQFGRAVSYLNMGTPLEIKASIDDQQDGYLAEMCGGGVNGWHFGELRAQLLLKGSEPPGTPVGVEVSPM
jgi:hypothetical protein